jgi:hypothetical protein
MTATSASSIGSPEPSFSATRERVREGASCAPGAIASRRRKAELPEMRTTATPDSPGGVLSATIVSFSMIRQRLPCLPSSGFAGEMQTFRSSPFPIV